MSLMVIKRTGEVVDFDRERIRVAIAKAIRATAPRDQWDSLENGTLSGVVADVTDEIDSRFIELYPNVENIQDIVEKHLVKNGLYEIAKAYILYRAERQQAREQRRERVARESLLGRLTVQTRNGRKVLFDIAKLTRSISAAAVGESGAGGTSLEPAVAVEEVARETIRNIYDGITATEIEKALLLACASFIERDPAYSQLAARLFLQRHLQGGDRLPVAPRAARRRLPPGIPRRPAARGGRRNLRSPPARLRPGAADGRVAPGTGRPAAVHGRADPSRTLFHPRRG